MNLVGFQINRLGQAKLYEIVLLTSVFLYGNNFFQAFAYNAKRRWVKRVDILGVITALTAV